MTSPSASKKRYGITRAVAGGARDFIKISRAEFVQVQQSRLKVLAALSIEELLDCTVENYLELEGDGLTISLRRGVTSDWRWNALVLDMQTVNRRLANLLSSAKQLMDVTPQRLNTIYGRSSTAAAALKKAQSAEYDASFGYRLMEALRNHTQHHGMPVGGLSFPHSREEVQSGGVRWRCTLEAKIFCRELRDNKKFKKSVAKELALKEEVDLFPLAREYVSGIGSAFGKLREVMNEDAEAWKMTLRGAVARARKEFEGVVGLAAVELDQASKKYTERCYLNEDPLDRHDALSSKNRSLSLVTSKYFASSE